MKSTNPFTSSDAYPQLTLSRFQDVEAALHDPRFSSRLHFSRNGNFARHWWMQLTHPFHAWHNRLQNNAIAALSEYWMAFSDPPAHTRLRGLLKQVFGPRVTRTLHHIQSSADQLTAKARANGGMRILDDWAFPLSALTTSHLLGLPPSDHVYFRKWFINPLVLFGQERASNPTDLEWSLKAIDYFRALITERRKRPQDDLISDLISVRDSDGGFSEPQLIAMSLLLLIAGYETTQRLLTAGLVHLIRNSQGTANLVREPKRMRNAVEELLRYITPLPSLRRRATCPIEFDRIRIPQGAMVHLDLKSANRDPAHFSQPDQLDFDRELPTHFSFGKGIHSCIGASLARIEAEVAFSYILPHAPQLVPGSALPRVEPVQPSDLETYELTFGTRRAHR
jgi:pimeloyl-[acyl-carrier protein] synthase